jgi:hypothetical protein
LIPELLRPKPGRNICVWILLNSIHSEALSISIPSPFNLLCSSLPLQALWMPLLPSSLRNLLLGDYDHPIAQYNSTHSSILYTTTRILCNNCITKIHSIAAPLRIGELAVRPHLGLDLRIVGGIAWIVSSQDDLVCRLITVAENLSWLKRFSGPDLTLGCSRKAAHRKACFATHKQNRNGNPYSQPVVQECDPRCTGPACPGRGPALWWRWQSTVVGWAA